jgi:hypothetical protein
MTTLLQATDPGLLEAGADASPALVPAERETEADVPAERLRRASHQPFLNFVRYLQGDRSAIGGTSHAVARHRAETALLASDRVLALLCRIEAVADHRIDNDVAAVSKLPNIRDLARAAITAHTGTPFQNPVFPVGSAGC